MRGLQQITSNTIHRISLQEDISTYDRYASVYESWAYRAVAKLNTSLKSTMGNDVMVSLVLKSNSPTLTAKHPKPGSEPGVTIAPYRKLHSSS